MSHLIRGEPLYTDGNDDEPKKAVTQHNAVTDVIEAVTGFTGFTFRLSLTTTGAAIHSTLSKTATEKGTTGIYFAVFEGVDLTTHLTAYVGQDVYEIFGDGVNVNYVTEREVMAVRP